MANIRDVARAAKTSATTTSRFLNGDPSLAITAATQQRILSAVEQLHYVKPARPVRQGTITLGLLVTKSAQDEYDDPYYRDIRRGILDESEQTKAAIGLTIHAGEPVDPLALRGIDGLIVIGGIARPWLHQLQQTTSLIVLVDDYDAPDDVDAIAPDASQAAVMVLDRLAGAGHQRIAFIGGPPTVTHADGTATAGPPVDPRLLAYQRWMHEHHLDRYREAYIGGWDYAAGAALAAQLVQAGKHPTAVVVASDPLAVGVYRGLNKAGLQIPRDIAVVSFDNSAVAGFLTPPLTTVQMGAYPIGRSAVRMLTERVHGDRDYPLHVFFPPRIVARESDAVQAQH
ncbi:LacI family DNA-binding transcriptional regulator [Schleiferilactobacillus shenzhenensis]|nr:LacI family DNA-binding transcriptional regulator [Schleiferilactobacillus shenzhenensis]